MGEEAAEVLAALDPEAEFLAASREEDSVANEWELFKENVRPLKRGRDIRLLNHALRSHADAALRRSLVDTRRALIEAIDEYKGDDPLQPWLDCIKWVQESFPTGGEYSGLLVIYEQCVRAFWHEDRYKDDLRYLKVWLEYAGNCADAEVIYRFLEANEIGQNHFQYYSSYALHMESKHRLKRADEIFNLGMARKAKPLEKLEADYRKFLARSARKKTKTEDDSTENHVVPVRSFGTVLTAGRSRRQLEESSGLGKRKVKLQRLDMNKPLPIYNDENSRASQAENLKNNKNAWHTLAPQADRNKENTSTSSKWASYKVPQRTGTRTDSATTITPIEVFVDEDRVEVSPADVVKSVKPCTLQLRKEDSQNLKKETELLKENPLRNFPLNSLR